MATNLNFLDIQPLDVNLYGAQGKKYWVNEEEIKSSEVEPKFPWESTDVPFSLEGGWGQGKGSEYKKEEWLKEYDVSEYLEGIDYVYKDESRPFLREELKTDIREIDKSEYEDLLETTTSTTQIPDILSELGIQDKKTEDVIKRIKEEETSLGLDLPYSTDKLSPILDDIYREERRIEGLEVPSDKLQSLEKDEEKTIMTKDGKKYDISDEAARMEEVTPAIGSASAAISQKSGTSSFEDPAAYMSLGADIAHMAAMQTEEDSAMRDVAGYGSGAVKIGAGIGLIATGAGAGVGLPMVASGVGDIFSYRGKDKAQKEAEQREKRYETEKLKAKSARNVQYSPGYLKNI